MLKFMVHAMNCITVGAGRGGGVPMYKLWAWRDNMKGNLKHRAD